MPSLLSRAGAVPQGCASQAVPQRPTSLWVSVCSADNPISPAPGLAGPSELAQCSPGAAAQPLRTPPSAHPALSILGAAILSPRRLCFRHCLRKPSAAPSPSLSGGPVGCEVISPADVDLSLEGGHVTCVLMKGAVRCARATCTGRAVGVIPTLWGHTVGAS